VQLVVVGLIVRHDRRTLGAVHPATLTVAAAIVVAHVLIEVVARTPGWIELANGMAGI
jgi:hypothetical protein